MFQFAPVTNNRKHYLKMLYHSSDFKQGIKALCFCDPVLWVRAASCHLLTATANGNSKAPSTATQILFLLSFLDAICTPNAYSEWTYTVLWTTPETTWRHPRKYNLKLRQWVCQQHPCSHTSDRDPPVTGNSSSLNCILNKPTPARVWLFLTDK